MDQAAWRWRPKGADGGRLLYEPGNWGDLLKGEWALRIVAWLLHEGVPELEYLDPFAGAPCYPLSPAMARRLARFPDTLVGHEAAALAARGLYPSTAAMVAEVARGHGGGRLAVFDLDPARRAACAGHPAFTVLDLASGWDALAGPLPGPLGLVLLDPYDFLAGWPERLDAVVAAAERTSVLLYAYNRAARGQAHLRAWRAFRNRLEDLLAGRPRLLGRLPSDAFLARAHHEVLFLPGPALAAQPRYPALVSTLEEATRRFACALRDLEAFEP